MSTEKTWWQQEKWWLVNGRKSLVIVEQRSNRISALNFNVSSPINYHNKLNAKCIWGLQRSNKQSEEGNFCNFQSFNNKRGLNQYPLQGKVECLSAFNGNRTHFTPTGGAAHFCVSSYRPEAGKEQKEDGVYYYLSAVSGDEGRAERPQRESHGPKMIIRQWDQFLFGTGTHRHIMVE